jgi:hypothetical protein
MPMPTVGEFEDLLRRGMARCPDCMLIGKQGPAVEFPADRASIRSSRGQFLCRHHLHLTSGDDADDLARNVLEFALMGASDVVIGEISGYRPGAVRKTQAFRRGRRQRKAALALAVLASRGDSVSAAQIARELDVPKTSVARIWADGLTPQARAGVRELRELPRDELETVLRFVVPRSLAAVLHLLGERDQDDGPK